MKRELTYAERAVKSRRRAKVSRVIGRISLGLAILYVTAFIALGMIFGNWTILMLTSAALLGTSGFSLLTSAQTELTTAARYERLARNEVTW